MNKLNLIAVALMGIFMVGCSTTNTGGDNQVGGTTAVENALPYIKPAVILACTVVLEQALSPEDRIEKAKMINNIATVVQSLTVGQTPTPDQLQKALSDHLPAEKTHWAMGCFILVKYSRSSATVSRSNCSIPLAGIWT